MNDVFELQYALDTFYFLMCGALVMWMAAGFSMLEAGLVRTKNTTVILTKNIALFGIACTMYMVCGYAIMYNNAVVDWNAKQSNTIPDSSMEGEQAVASRASKATMFAKRFLFPEISS